MKHIRHALAGIDGKDRYDDEFCREYGSFEALFRRRKYNEAETSLSKLFLICYERFPETVYMLLLAESALKAECGQIMKAIRLNRVLLAELREYCTVSDIERIASANLIYDLNSLGYAVGAMTESRTIMQREVEQYKRNGIAY